MISASKKARVLAAVLILVSVGLIYLGRRQLLSEGRYSMKLAAFAPVVGIGGIFLMIFPSMAGKPTTAKEKIIVLVVLGIGMLAGLVNWYLMDPGFFGRQGSRQWCPILRDSLSGKTIHEDTRSRADFLNVA